jgi:hypothetical protein
VVYGREVAGQTLELEASGALLEASLVMRDRQTDSWWSIMSSEAIGGPLEGTALPELPVGTKTTWSEWRRLHPDTLVLSVGGVEHVADNPYDNYFAGDGTFRGVKAADDRLPPREPVFAFHLDGEPWAAPHRAFAGGGILALPDGRPILLFRPRDAEIYRSSEAWLVGERPAEAEGVEELLAAARGGAAGLTPVAGFDTFWYTWSGVNRDSRILGR